MLAVWTWIFCGPGVLTFSPMPLPFASVSWKATVPCSSSRQSQGTGWMCSVAGSVDSDNTHERHPIYWIDECQPNEGVVELALRHNKNLPLFLKNKPVAEFNKQAFETAKKAYEEYCDSFGGKRVPIVLDSCCGTGRSTACLAGLRPNSFVVGIDKSLVRLERNKGFRDTSGQSLPANNMVLVRANCIDFWRCAWEAGWEPEEHFILYPNPYPKEAQLNLRWHGSPAFPILLNLGGVIQVRASWRTYLEEMAMAADAVKGKLSSKLDRIFASNEDQIDVEGPLSNFEIKYIAAKQPVYRLRMPHISPVSPEAVMKDQAV